MKAVLFDLDDTLLCTDTSDFMKRYFMALGTYLHEYGEPKQIARWIIEASKEASDTEHASQTNAEVFSEAFSRYSGVEFSRVAPAFETFYAQVYPHLGDDLVAMPGARSAVLAAKQAGCKIVVATQPLFKEDAIRQRLQWAGLDDIAFTMITNMDNMHYAKPQPNYYREIAAMIGVPAKDCLMVGNDLDNDIRPAQATGMDTYLVVEDGQVVPEADIAGGSLVNLLPLLKNGK